MATSDVPASSPPPPLIYAPPACEPPIIYQDAALLVLDKPAGLLSVPGRGPDNADCLASRIQARFPEARIVHRLDMATSGQNQFVNETVSFTLNDVVDDLDFTAIAP